MVGRILAMTSSSFWDTLETPKGTGGKEIGVQNLVGKVPSADKFRGESRGFGVRTLMLERMTPERRQT